MKIAVYCSSRANLDKAVVIGAQLIASAIGKANASLVYGGVNAGLMHTVADAAKQAGANIIGVIPEVFIQRADPFCDKIIPAEDLNRRKGIMIDMADVFVVLPGGLGTIDEWISTLSHILVQERVDPSADKPILVWNHEGIYDELIAQLSRTNDSVYARGKRVDRSEIFNSADELAARLAELTR
ncbi:MAG: TIGR00730 family Rossman fold protein [Prevotella sp.]|nr:TIGR00730 family Rossman fold protein [Prevotella sp.]MCM1075442.1 TIGR00730 family Rossman fold protein [Ruminococcus sp.]